MTRDDELIAQGWAYRVHRDRPGVRTLVSPTEQTRLGHELYYSIPRGDEQLVTIAERRQIAERRAAERPESADRRVA